MLKCFRQHIFAINIKGELNQQILFVIQADNRFHLSHTDGSDLS